MKVSMHQPNYLPYLWLFEKIKRSDLFIITEMDQFARRDWHDKNFIRNRDWKFPLKIPCKLPEIFCPIKDVTFDRKILDEHFFKIENAYKNAKNWCKYGEDLKKIFSYQWDSLAEFNSNFIRRACKQMWIDTKIVNMSELVDYKHYMKNDDIIYLCKLVWADTYISWLWAKEYMDVEKYEKEWIKIEWMPDATYMYRQRYADFIPNLSVIDFLCCSDEYRIVENT